MNDSKIFSNYYTTQPVNTPSAHQSTYNEEWYPLVGILFLGIPIGLAVAAAIYEHYCERRRQRLMRQRAMLERLWRLSSAK
jgi:hypothetical protein